jgi:hypothetical protein
VWQGAIRGLVPLSTAGLLLHFSYITQASAARLGHALSLVSLTISISPRVVAVIVSFTVMVAVSVSVSVSFAVAVSITLPCHRREGSG